MKSKTKITLSRALTALVTVVIGAGAVLKLIGLESLVTLYSRIGLLPYLEVLGVVELLFVAMFLWRPTQKIGLLLLTGYFGGAMAVELSHGTVFIAPGMILTLVWVTGYLRNASSFIETSAEVRKPINPALI